MTTANFTVNSFALIFDRLITDGVAAANGAPARITDGVSYAVAFKAASEANDNRRAATEFLDLVFAPGAFASQPSRQRLEKLRILCRDLDARVERYANNHLR